MQAKHFPEMFRSIQRKAHSKSEINTLISKHCDDMLRLYGKKEPLVHDKGYYQSCDAGHKFAVHTNLLQYPPNSNRPSTGICRRNDAN